MFFEMENLGIILHSWRVLAQKLMTIIATWLIVSSNQSYITNHTIKS